VFWCTFCSWPMEVKQRDSAGAESHLPCDTAFLAMCRLKLLCMGVTQSIRCTWLISCAQLRSCLPQTSSCWFWAYTAPPFQKTRACRQSWRWFDLQVVPVASLPWLGTESSQTKEYFPCLPPHPLHITFCILCQLRNYKECDFILSQVKMQCLVLSKQSWFSLFSFGRWGNICAERLTCSTLLWIGKEPKLDHMHIWIK
jgi:hypothetical protein